MDCSLERFQSIAYGFSISAACMNISDNMIKFIWSTIVERAVAMPDGDVYLVTTGLASGHGWTSLIETTWMVFLCTVCISSLLRSAGLDDDEIIPFIQCEIVMGLMGDDGRIGLSSLASSLISWNDFAKLFERFFHGRLRPAKCNIERFPRGFTIGDTLPGFLGKYYIWTSEFDVMVTRPLEESLAIALWPERGVENAGASWNIAAGLLIDNRDPRWISIVRRYLHWLEQCHPDDITPGVEWHATVKTTVFLEFSQSNEPLVPLARVLSDYELSQLYCD
jgi:hypothetical protein